MSSASLETGTESSNLFRSATESQFEALSGEVRQKPVCGGDRTTHRHRRMLKWCAVARYFDFLSGGE